MNIFFQSLAAVNRCASVVPRHDGRIIWLTYEPTGKIEKTIMMVGKGITYDTGGADIKTDMKMAGMSRDKCGAADIAGFMKVASILKPKNVKIVCAMAMVRNSVGSDAYVADEIFTSRAGVRLRVVNTDAEGRMAMADVLAHMKEKALNEINPHLMTVATLTGHARMALGNYTVKIIPILCIGVISTVDCTLHNEDPHQKMSVFRPAIRCLPAKAAQKQKFLRMSAFYCKYNACDIMIFF